MARTAYALEEFVHDMTELVKSQPDQERLFNVGSSYLERLINNPDALPEEYRVPAGSRGRSANHGSYILHRGEGLAVTSVVWGPGDHIAPHDHRTWGMIGVMDNAITETRFNRKDDRSKVDFAVLEKTRETLVRPGEVSLLIPEVDEIHQMDNHSDRPTVEIHVYGKDLKGLERCMYNLETGAMKTFSTTRWDNC
ncbi:MAG: cysteine dioxygenase family protein [Chloroflexi bacterium]|nr:cysteine dioxygenase family protein [Chloroflexota bacterium]